MAVTAANVHDSQLLGDLLHGDETRVWGDSAIATNIGQVRLKCTVDQKTELGGKTIEQIKSVSLLLTIRLMALD